MIRCDYCKQKNQDGELECRRCGAPLPERRERSRINIKVETAPGTNADLSKNWRFSISDDCVLELAEDEYPPYWRELPQTTEGGKVYR